MIPQVFSHAFPSKLTEDTNSSSHKDGARILRIDYLVSKVVSHEQKLLKVHQNSRNIKIVSMIVF